MLYIKFKLKTKVNAKGEHSIVLQVPKDRMEGRNIIYGSRHMLFRRSKLKITNATANDEHPNIHSRRQVHFLVVGTIIVK